MSGRPSAWRRRGGFSLVELLVVVAIIAVLMSLLIPSLQRAKEKAADVKCGSTMRQCLVSIVMYNTQYEKGLQNYDPTCPFWGIPWPDYSSVDYHTEAHYNYAGGLHIWSEMRSARCFWRGYLIDSGIAKSNQLGCSARDFTGDAFYSSYNTPAGVAPTDQSETDPQQASFRKNPAFIWYGPGSVDDNVATYVGGNLTWWPEHYPTYSDMNNRALPGPLITRPAPRIGLFIQPDGINNAVPFTAPHRPRMGNMWAFGSLQVMPYAENVGFTDGSVSFYQNANGGTINLVSTMR